MEKEELQYKQQLRKLKRQEQEKQEREKGEALRRQQEEKEAQDREQARKAALYMEQDAKSQKKLKNSIKMGGESVSIRKEATKVKPTVAKAKKQVQKNQKAKVAAPKIITSVNLPPVEPEDYSVSEENQDDLGGYDSPPPELPDDGLLNLLSLDKGSDSDVDDEPSMVSLILPAAEDSPKRQPSPSKKKTLTPRKRFAKKKGPSIDFNFTNAEARRQAKAEMEAAEQEESDGAESEPEPAPATSTPQKRLKRRKEGHAAALGGKSLMATMANTTIPVKKKKGAGNSIADKPTSSSAVGKKNPRTKGKLLPKNGKTSAEAEEKSTVAPTRKKVGSRSEPMSIKQRLANAELLARINKMQDISTPKVLGKKSKKTQDEDILAAKRAGFRKGVATDVAAPNVSQRDQMMEDGDLNISLNSSGLISDDESPGNLRAPSRKRPRGPADGDVTPAKKLQFLEITKRLAKSPMPRYLRTPTPLMSPMVGIKPKAASPGPRPTSVRSIATTRRLNSAPVRPKKTTTGANRFGIPGGGGGIVSNGGGFSMFDAFVNSGSGGAIPRLKVKSSGDVSPSV
ncbi:hypothetical protein P3T76_000665 [Phytophthora citrophthora]|uniref:Uncharacterized protein n=1 Tax=Phytophthora citrophthora TaxID=4793 RepID=A0AAD9H1K4_9STRA|nr:hypothetical protein P3T76_000665 [Phytophthora citrophthora]